jgi:hypothetical protein
MDFNLELLSRKILSDSLFAVAVTGLFLVARGKAFSTAVSTLRSRSTLID